MKNGLGERLGPCANGNSFAGELEVKVEVEGGETNIVLQDNCEFILEAVNRRGYRGE